MHIVRWLMSHPIISAWLLAGLAILLNFDSGSHKGDEHKAAASDAHVEQNHEQAAQGTEAPATTTEVSAEHAVTAPAPTPTVEATSSVASTAAPAAVATESVAIAPTQVSDPAMAGQATTVLAPVVTESAPASAKANQPAAPATTAGKEVVASQASSATAPQQAPAAATDKDLSSKAPNELLQMARQAYQDKNLNSSVAAYQALLKLEPNKIEYKGELGNVYYHQNKQKEAANMYAEIALPLIDQGGSEQVANMLGFIGAFYPQKAAEINKYMQAHK